MREEQCASQVPACVAAEVEKRGPWTEVLEDKPPALVEGWLSVNGNTFGCEGPKGIFVLGSGWGSVNLIWLN